MKDMSSKRTWASRFADCNGSRIIQDARSTAVGFKERSRSTYWEELGEILGKLKAWVMMDRGK